MPSRVLLAASAAAAAAAAATLALLWRRRRLLRLHQQREQLIAQSSKHAATRSSDGCRSWADSELAALHYSAEYLFVYKQYDLHMDHATVPVSLATQLMHNWAALADAKTAFGFRHVHQLDFATSGVLCIALNKRAASAASRLFESRTVSKRYLALVEGHPSWEHVRVERAVGEDATDERGFRMALEGDTGCVKPLPAQTDCYVVERGTLHGKPVSKLLLCPQSGRRHQLRLHCLFLGHGVVGDVAYTGDRASPRMMLHAWMLRLPLPKAPQPVCVASFDPYPATAPDSWWWPWGGGGGGGGASGGLGPTTDASGGSGADAVHVVPEAEFDVEATLRRLRGGGGGGRARNGVSFHLRDPPAGAKYSRVASGGS